MKSSLERLASAKEIMRAYQRPKIPCVELPPPRPKQSIDERLAYYRCPHRSQETVTIESRPLGCGCGTLALHECDLFHELIIIRTSSKIAASERLQKAVPRFQGRTCMICKAWQTALIDGS